MTELLSDPTYVEFESKHNFIISFLVNITHFFFKYILNYKYWNLPKPVKCEIFKINFQNQFCIFVNEILWG